MSRAGQNDLQAPPWPLLIWPVGHALDRGKGGLRMIEWRMRPFIELEHAERLLSEVHDLSAPGHNTYSSRAGLPLPVLRAQRPKAEKVVVEGRTLAGACCAPQMFAFTD